MFDLICVFCTFIAFIDDATYSSDGNKFEFDDKYDKLNLLN